MKLIANSLHEELLEDENCIDIGAQKSYTPRMISHTPQGDISILGRMLYFSYTTPPEGEAGISAMVQRRLLLLGFTEDADFAGFVQSKVVTVDTREKITEPWSTRFEAEHVIATNKRGVATALELAHIITLQGVAQIVDNPIKLIIANANQKLHENSRFKKKGRIPKLNR